MPTCKANGIELYYETFGEDADPPLLLVMGLGAQMIAWDEEFCLTLVDRGFRVIRFDNRDVGLSSKIEGGGSIVDAMAKAAQGQAISAPYTLSDMAADAIGLLDHLGIDRAHVVGASMGGMIAQAIAIEHPTRGPDPHVHHVDDRRSGRRPAHPGGHGSAARAAGAEPGRGGRIGGGRFTRHREP